MKPACTVWSGGKAGDNFKSLPITIIIGGTACDLIMENEELPFRATKDIDIVLIVESITAEFGRQFWKYVKEAG